MKLWTHQAEAIEFAESRHAVYLDMAMGTGKSLVACELLKRWNAKRILIICPVSVMSVWRREFAKWTTIEPTILDKGTCKKKAERARLAQVVVVNYESAWREPLGSLLTKRQWDVIILDEAHRIGGHNTAVSKFAHRLTATRKLCLSGTPMDNPMHLWSQFRFLDANVFGYRFHAYRTRYARLKQIPTVPVPIIVGWQNLDELRHTFRQHAYHADASLLNLLPTQTIDVPVELETKAARAYRSMERELVADIDGGIVTASNALVRLLRLQQITGGSVTDEDGGTVVVSTAKQNTLRELIADIGLDQQIVVFGVFTADLWAVQQVADDLKRPYREISGNRKDALTDHGTLLDDPGQVVGVQIRSGGVGIDLTRASYGIYYSTGFSYRDFAQSLARLDRPGQDRHVTFYRLQATGTVDEQVYKALDAKADVVAEIVGAMAKQPAVLR